MSIHPFRIFRGNSRRDKNPHIEQFRSLFEKFQQILAGNNSILESLSEMEDRLSGEYIFDMKYLRDRVDQLSETIYRIVYNLNKLTDNRYPELFEQYEKIHDDLKVMVEEEPTTHDRRLCIPYSEINYGMNEMVGGKNAHIGDLRNEVHIRTPEGFAVTTQAFRAFMDHNDLWKTVEGKIEALRRGGMRDGDRYDREIDALFEAAEVPRELAKAIQKSVNDLYRRLNDRPLLAVRSSAVGEDKVDRSYAGQFLSVLDCRSEDVLPAYKRVLASQYHYSALVYADEEGRDGREAFPMAVGIQEMIPSRSAGVLYTIDPSGCIECLIVTAVWGSGANAVLGMENSDYFQIQRLDPSRIVKRRIGKKKRPSVPGDGGNSGSDPMEEKASEEPCLTDCQLAKLAELALTMERFFQRPLDIEWCLDDRDEFCILQARPLHLAPRSADRSDALREATRHAPVLMKEKGDIAQRGIAAGKVWLVHEEDDPQSFPVGAIAVSRFTSPRLTSIVRRASAIITDVGSSTGHMATIAREFAVPTIVGTEHATQLLKTGMEVTVDAEENIVYEGIIRELLEYELRSEDAFREKKEYRILRRVLKRMTPLNMIDPRQPEFTARNCRSYHDLIRFCHEKAMECLIELNPRSKRFKGVRTSQLKLSIPLGLSVIDIGGGVEMDGSPKSIESLDAVRSIPMRSILEGLTAPGVWSTKPVHLGLNDFMSSLTRYSVMDQSADYKGQNLAVLAEHYMNLSLRLGYHFNVIDTYVSDNANDNYVYFRFVGGVTENERRHRRALLLQKILEKLDFWVAVTGDLVIARLTKWPADEQLRILVILGRLIGFTRQLDTQLFQDEDIETYTQEFFRFSDSLDKEVPAEG